MGLGSKTPLCYTDTFLVTSIYKGMKYTYSVFINESGCPFIAPLSKEATTEHSGLEVSFSVEESDFYNFKTEVEITLNYYKVLPKIYGNSNALIAPVIYSKQGKNWGVRKGGNVHGMQAVMGNIAYRIKSDVHALAGANIDVFFDIGDFEVTASREDISYEGDTRTYLANIISNIKTEIQTEIDEQFKVVDSYWKAVEIFSSVHNSIDNIIASHFDFAWNGVKIYSTSFELLATKDLREKYGNLRFREYKKNYYGFNKLNGVGQLTLSNKYIFILEDVTYAVHKRLEQVRNEYPGYSVVLYDDPVLADGKPGNLWEQYQKQMGLPGTILSRKLSEFTYEKVKTIVKSIYMKNVLSYEHGDYKKSKASEHWDVPEDFDIEDGGIYLDICKYKVGANGEHPWDYVERHFELLRDIKVTTDDIVIYGVKDKELESFKASPKWVDLATYVKQETETYFTRETLIAYSVQRDLGDKPLTVLSMLSSAKMDFADYQIYDTIPMVTKANPIEKLSYATKDRLRSMVMPFYRTEVQLQLDTIQTCSTMIAIHCPLISTFYNAYYDIKEEHLKNYMLSFLPKKV
jgi:hypothetical protein